MTYDRNGHGVAPSAETVASGSKVTTPTPPTAAGYTFGGWYKESTCETAWNFATDTVTADTTLYAKWTYSGTFSPVKDMNIYLDLEQASSILSAISGGKKVWYRFLTSTGADRGWTEATGHGKNRDGSDYSGLYYFSVPNNGDCQVQVRIATNVAGAGEEYTSDIYAITGADTNTLIADSSNNYADSLSLPRNSGNGNKSGGFGYIYFDNTLTNWTVDDSNKIYFVIGRGADSTRAAYQDVRVMTKVANTSNLYYLDKQSTWDNYTYFGFSLISTTKAGADGSSMTGAYEPTDASMGVLTQATKYTSFVSMYDLAQSDQSGNTQNKSFIGEGESYNTNGSKLYAVDMLWISNNGVDSSDGSHENEYLNRGINLSVVGTAGSAKISGYKANSVGASGVESQAATTVAAGNNSDVYYARTSTVTLSGLVAPTDYELDSVTVNDVNVTSFISNGEYTFTLPGGDDVDCTKIPVVVTYTALPKYTVTIGDSNDVLSAFEESFNSMNGIQSLTGSFTAGTTVTLSFDNLPAGNGITGVTGTNIPAGRVISGHTITFVMPALPVTVTGITTSGFTAKVTVNDKDKLDIIGITDTYGYFIGDDVGEIVISGSDDYASASVLSGITASISGASPETVTVTSGSSTITKDDHTLTIAYNATTKKVTITGHIGGPLTLTPVLSTKYNLNITNTILSDTIANKTRIQQEISHDDGDYPVGSMTVSVDEAGGDGFEVAEADEDGDVIESYPGGSSIKLTFDFGKNETESAGSFYQFVGWYEGNSSGPVSPAPGDYTSLTYYYTVSKSTYIYAVVTRDLFIGGQAAIFGEDCWVGGHKKMDFDTDRGLYYYKSNFTGDADYSYLFRLYDEENIENKITVYTGASIAQESFYGPSLGTENNGNISDGAACSLQLTQEQRDAGYTTDITIYYNPKSKKIFAISDFSNKSIYLSSGHSDSLKNLFTDSDANNPTVTVSYSGMTLGDFKNDGSAVTVTDDSGTKESWKKVVMTADSSTFTVSAAISCTTAANAANFKIDHFVVYDLDNMTRAKAVNAVAGASNTYTASITADSSILIVPVIELSAAGLTASGASEYAVNVNAGNVSPTEWGGMVSMYVSGTSETIASWPGQVMVPSDDGETYTGTIYVKSGITFNGISFTNYNHHNMLAKYQEVYAYPNTAQTYDYREPVGLIESGADNTLTFKLKQNNDGYHGAYYNAINSTNTKDTSSIYYLYPGGTRILDGKTCDETAKGKIYKYKIDPSDSTSYESLTESYQFEYLLDGNGNRMSLNGESVGSAAPGFYVICVGDFNYQAGQAAGATVGGKVVDNQYSINGHNYSGEYSVEWFIYDADCRYLGHYLSAAVYDRDGSSAYSYIVDSILADSALKTAMTDNNGTMPTLADLTGKSVKISYEAANTRYSNANYDEPTTRFSGQWVKVSNNKDVTATVIVGVKDSLGNITYTLSNSHASYGTAYAGSSAGSVNGADASVKLKNGTIYLHAKTVVEPAEFDGWYTKGADGTWIRFSTSTDEITTTITGDTNIYAIYKVPAYYDFVYPDRTGSQKHYKVTRYLNQSEIDGYSGNNNIAMTPTFLCTSDAMSLYNYTNPLQSVVADINGTATAYRKTLSWDNLVSTSTPANISASTGSRTTTVTATSTDTKYTVKYAIGEGNAVEGATNVPYGKVVTFSSAHAGDSEYAYISADVPVAGFSYWSADAAGEKILTKNINFGMILSGSFADNNNVVTIYAQYNKDAPANIWNPLIEDATQTRSITSDGSTTTDKTVADYLANYLNYNGDSIHDLIAGGTSVTYGLIVMRYTESVNQTAMISALNKLITAGRTSANIGDSNHLAMRFEYDDANHISNFNRTLYTVSANTSAMSGKTLTAMAYVKVGDNYYYSPINTDISVTAE